MEPITEDIFLQTCLTQVEKKLNWGSSELWVNQDFENLSEKIEEATGVQLSVTTLKRIWGKVKYKSKPTITTLNALAGFIGFQHWRAFKQSLNVQTEEKPESIVDEEVIVPAKVLQIASNRAKRHKAMLQAAIIVIIFLAGFLVYSFSSKTAQPAKIDPSKFAFSSGKTVASGVPNSVIFDYNAKATAPTDSIFIQQSWDKRLSQQVSRDENQHTSIYYYPGFFKAKLVVNKQVVKEHNLFIQTNGWLPLAEQSPVPVYFKEADIKHNGTLGLPLSKLKGNNILLQPETPWVDYYNVRTFGGVNTRNFTFETEVKNDYIQGSAVCGNIQVKILTEGSAIVMPLSIKGCVSDLSVIFVDSIADGKTNDLSAFGCDVSQWVKLRCEVINKRGSIYVNGHQAFQMSFTSPVTNITGIVYHFQGTGSVRQVTLSKIDGTVVYQEKF